MGKKKAEEMAKQQASFIEGAKQNGISEEDADRVFKLIDHFSGYGFNKSHSAAYAVVAYHCAYLKAHYPVEFLCATMTADKDKVEKVVRTVAEARAMGITVLPPDVNQSEVGFTVVYGAAPETKPAPKGKPISIDGVLRDPERPAIRFGLGAIKGVGSAALEAVFDARGKREDGEPLPASSGQDGQGAPLPPVDKEPFLQLFDFTSRVDLRRVNKAVVEALVQSGAFDSLHEPNGVHRAQALGGVDAAIERGKVASADRESGQTDLFGLMATEEVPRAQHAGAAFAPAPTWDRKEKLRREKAALGFYLSGHPLDGYREELKRFCNATTASLEDKEDGAEVTIGGLVEDLRVRPTKTGGKIAFVVLEDPLGRVELIVREKALEANRELLVPDTAVLVTGKVRKERDPNADPDSDAPTEVKLLLDKVEPLAESLRAKTRSVRVRVHVDRIDKTKLVELRRALEDFPGACPVTLQLVSDEAWNVTMGTRKILVDPTEAMLARLERLFGEKVCELR
jgi:DNA polymerase-3 subunit alpha